MKNSLGDKIRLQHIYDAISEIVSYTANISFEEFKSNSMILFASVKQLEIIGEAANNITEQIHRSTPTASVSRRRLTMDSALQILSSAFY